MQNKEKNIILKRLIRSYLSSVLSISLVLLLVGAVSFFAVNAKNISTFFKENVVVSLILEQNVDSSDGEKIASALSQEDFVKSATFISKEQGTEEMKQLLGEDFLDVFQANPIPASIELRLDGNSVNPDSLMVIKGELLAMDGVSEVDYQESVVDALNANLRKISLILGVVILLLLVISFALIGNTVRLNLYAKRFTIHTMRMVGAKRSFICRPFIGNAVIQGAVSGVLASVLLVVSMRILFDKVSLPLPVDENVMLAAVCSCLLLAGIVICVMSTVGVVSRLAYSTKDDLYY